jgi:class 3 adenylate cyclase/tetratricopeptide (TPR) repeat protein
VTTCPNCGAENPTGNQFCGKCGSSLAVECSACGAENPPDNGFCGACGAALRSAAASTTPPTAERRLVSVLFADLVGFTAASEDRDAEDTRELLSRYFDTCRRLIELYGGTVEKFIGDAVMAVWGTPSATEDDAERAVRAALDLVAAVSALGDEVGVPELRARAGVLTGEAAVSLAAEGQGMVAGGLVNTASRIQSIAEQGTVLVGEATRRATDQTIAYEDAGTRELKGKAEPVPLYRATRVVAARAGEGRSTGLEAPFVGRERELRLVKDLFHATAAEGRAHLLAVVGVAGIGKSRLAWEFEKYADGVVETVYWHRGRCLAYGDGVAYWALAEMVRSRARITESEDESSALRKLSEAVAEYVPDPSEREWIEPRLQQLLGLVERTASDREDLFSAWRRFFEHLAEEATVALVFEDLHWADSGLIAFIEHLLDWSRRLPIFVLALARPELAERHPGFPGATRNATTLVLDPLSDEAMDELLRGLVPGLPEELHGEIRSRADGIPLYAIETVRMLLDRRLLAPAGNEYRLVAAIASLEVPETLHALIAARLDGLEPEERRLLERAAVLGKTFTIGGLAALSALDPAEAEPVLASLARKELLAIDNDPRSPERGQYGFLQALVQRIAYETLARSERRSLHLSAASFLAERAGIDPDEIAEVIATHYRDAYQAAPSDDDAESVRSQALEWFRRAGERSAALSATEDARRAFDDATELAADDVERAALLERAGELAFASDELDLAIERLEESRTLYLAAGRTHDAARAAVPLCTTLWNLARIDEALDLAKRALDVLATDEPDEDLARLQAETARLYFFRGEVDPALAHVEQSLAIAEAQILPLVLSQALNTKSLLIGGDHPREARALLREALDVALEHDLIDAALRAYNNLVVVETEMDHWDQSRRLIAEGFDLARRRGGRHWVVNFAGWDAFFMLSDGRWDEAFAHADEYMPEQHAAQVLVANLQNMLAAAALYRGDSVEAKRRLGLVAPEVFESTDWQLRSSALMHEMLSAMHDGNPRHALSSAGAWIDNEVTHESWAVWALTLVTTIAEEHGFFSELAELVARFDELPARHRTRQLVGVLGRARGVLAASRDDEDGAAEAFGVALAAARSKSDCWLTAEILTDYGRALVSFGRPHEAEPLLAEARELWEQMGAESSLARITTARSEATVRA